MNLKQFWSDLGGKLGVGLIGAGFLLVFLGWNGAASVDRVPAQFPYLISGGIGGLSLVIVGVGILIVQNQRSDRAQLQATLDELRRALSPDEDEPAATGFQPPAPRPTPEKYAPVTRQIEIIEPDDDGDDASPGGSGRRDRRAPLRADGS